MKFSDAGKAHTKHRKVKLSEKSPTVIAEGFDLDGNAREQYKNRLKQAATKQQLKFGKAIAVITKSEDSFTVQINLSGRKSHSDAKVCDKSLELAFQSALTESLSNKTRAKGKKNSRTARADAKKSPVPAEISHKPDPSLANASRDIVDNWLAGRPVDQLTLS